MACSCTGTESILRPSNCCYQTPITIATKNQMFSFGLNIYLKLFMHMRHKNSHTYTHLHTLNYLKFKNIKKNDTKMLHWESALQYSPKLSELQQPTEKGSDMSTDVWVYIQTLYR